MKYKLDKYKVFEDFIKFKNDELLICENKISDNDSYKNIYAKLEEFQKNGFKNEIIKEDISNDGKINFDDFYEIYTNFYNNVYKNSEEEDKLLILIQFFFDKEKYLEIKKVYEINPEDIELLLYGYRYRYWLNEISEEYNGNEEYIYTSLYGQSKMQYLD